MVRLRTYLGVRSQTIRLAERGHSCELGSKSETSIEMIFQVVTDCIWGVFKGQYSIIM